jgi:hypothetical protein
MSTTKFTLIFCLLFSAVSIQAQERETSQEDDLPQEMDLPQENKKKLIDTNCITPTSNASSLMQPGNLKNGWCYTPKFLQN